MTISLYLASLIIILTVIYLIVNDIQGKKKYEAYKEKYNELETRSMNTSSRNIQLLVELQECEKKISELHVELGEALMTINTLADSRDNAVEANIGLMQQQRIYVDGIQRIKQSNTRQAMSGYVYMKDIKGIDVIISEVYESIRSVE